MFKLEGRTILIVSNEPWGDVWYSKHNWANELSQNNTVYFVNSPVRWTFKGLFQNKISVKNYSESLFILDYKNRLPLTRFNLLYKLNNYIVSKDMYPPL